MVHGIVRAILPAAAALLLVALGSGTASAAYVWETEIVYDWLALDDGQFTSLELTSTGNPRISYYDYATEDLKYARYDGTEWHTEDVDTEGNVGWYTSLALNRTGYPRISYYDETNGDLKYASYSIILGWRVETVAQPYKGMFSSLALDDADRPHISYQNRWSWALEYAWKDGSEWQIESVDTEGGGRVLYLACAGRRR